ncbi:MAG TPA: GNAT family N-acetyltransferase [Acidimicrobiales bacterium]|jgi:putative acetyltransferase
MVADLEHGRRSPATVGIEDVRSPDAQRLIGELDTELSALYPPEENFFDLDAAEVHGAAGAFFVARLDGDAVGCAAIRMLSDTTGEVKRMYVSRAQRGLGIGRALLENLEQWAGAAGATELVLETGRFQPEAMSLYERSGFAAIPRFGQYVDSASSVCYCKRFVSR